MNVHNCITAWTYHRYFAKCLILFHQIKIPNITVNKSIYFFGYTFGLAYDEYVTDIWFIFIQIKRGRHSKMEIEKKNKVNIGGSKLAAVFEECVVCA